MSGNSSSLTNSSADPLLPPCFNSTVTFLISTGYSATRAALLLPLSILVLYLGNKRRRRQRSSSAASHSDVFTFHAAAMELMWVSAVVLQSSSSGFPEVALAGICISSIAYLGQTALNLLTCVERYLAVVHPVTYLGLRMARGVRIRNIAIGCAWLLPSAWIAIAYLYYPDSATAPYLCFLVLSFVGMSFCSLSVLCVLIRPGPGDRGRVKGRVDQMKERAFATISAIMGAMWLCFGGLLVALAVDTQVTPSVGCVVRASVLWCSLPASFVLPVLYLLRVGKLLSCG